MRTLSNCEADQILRSDQKLIEYETLGRLALMERPV